MKIAATSERDRHALLQRAGVPVPHLLVQAARDNGQVVRLFECLDTIGVDIGDPTEVSELLQVLAQLNAVDAGREVPPLPAGRPEAEFTESVQRALRTVVDLGLRRDLHVEPWMAAYANAKRQGTPMPRALTHGEFYFQQVGRRNDGPLVVFDLATVGWRPRFSDLCSILAPIAAGAGETERKTFRRYLTMLQDLGAAVPDVADAFFELRWLRVLSGFESLPWLTSSYKDPHLVSAEVTP